jgi:hypothetical protein
VRFALVVPTSIMLLAGCSQSIPYAGDGRLIDNGVTAKDTRYIVEAGSVDLSRAGTATFRMSGLPRTFFVVGLQVPVRADRAATLAGTTPADVSLQVYQENHGMAALITTPLRDWTWSRSARQDAAFVYLPQSPRSYFDAFAEARYQVTVTVNVPDPSIPAGSLVVFKSAGWK